MKYYILIALSIFFSVASNFFLKKGATITKNSNLIDLININLFYGLLLLAFAFISYYLALSKININILYITITTFSVVLITIMGSVIFGEKLTIKHIISIIIILFGIVLLYS